MTCRFDSCQAHFYSCESTPLQTNKSKTKDGPINLGMTVEYRLNNQLSTFYNHNIYLPGFLNQSETLPETNMFGKVTTLNAINFGLMNHFDVLTRHEPSQSIDSTRRAALFVVVRVSPHHLYTRRKVLFALSCGRIATTRRKELAFDARNIFFDVEILLVLHGLTLDS